MPMGFDRKNNESVDHFGSMDILTMLSFLVHNYRMFVYFYFLWVFAMFYSFSISLVEFIPKYFTLFDGIVMGGSGR